MGWIHLKSRVNGGILKTVATMTIDVSTMKNSAEYLAPTSRTLARESLSKALIKMITVNMYYKSTLKVVIQTLNFRSWELDMMILSKTRRLIQHER